MAWMSREQKSGKEQVSSSAQSNGKTTIIGEGLEIQGELIAKEDIWIAGQMNGKIVSDRRVVVAASGKVSASIQCRNLVIYGEVKGNVNAELEVVIEASGRLLGDLVAPQFIAKPGGFFEGYSRMADALKGEAVNVAEFQKKKVSKG